MCGSLGGGVASAAAGAGSHHRPADGGTPLSLLAALLYFGSLVLEGILSSAQESLLVLFGQKMTHALRREMSQS